MPVINLEAALERFDNETDIYVELIESFMEGGDADIANMESALAAGDMKKALYHTHKMKGGALTLGADALGATAEKLEIMLRGEESPEVRSLARDIRPMFEQARAELAGILANLKKQP